MVHNAVPAPGHGHHAPPWLWPAALFIGKHLATVALAMALLGALARPMAEDFIKDTVDERLNLLEMQMNDVRQSSRDMQREQAVMSTDIGNLKETARDTKRDTRMILQSLQGLRGELADAE